MRLVLTGADTGLRQELGEAVSKLGLGERVIFAGYVSDEELSALLTGAKALIFPSLFEGFGMAAGELGIPLRFEGEGADEKGYHGPVPGNGG